MDVRSDLNTEFLTMAYPKIAANQTDSLCINKEQLLKYPSIHLFMHSYIHQLRVKQMVEPITAVSGGMWGYTQVK